MNQGGESQPDLDQIEGLDISTSQKKRATFLWVLLETGNVKQAAATSGLGEHAKRRIQTMLKERGSIECAPHPRHPLIYADEVMEEAVQKLVDWENGFPTGQQLIKKTLIKKTQDLFLWHSMCQRKRTICKQHNHFFMKFV
jgi:hypothetical protein